MLRMNTKTTTTRLTTATPTTTQLCTTLTTNLTISRGQLPYNNSTTAVDNRQCHRTTVAIKRKMNTLYPLVTVVVVTIVTLGLDPSNSNNSKKSGIKLSNTKLRHCSNNNNNINKLRHLNINSPSTNKNK